jgi:arylsulfatase A-like enzyme
MRVLIAIISVAVLVGCSPDEVALRPEGTTTTPEAVPTFPVPAADARPNILFILTDDQDAASLSSMKRLQRELVKGGASFSNYMINVSTCCPSRASTLRGQYAHNTGLWVNDAPDGGFQRMYKSRLEASTIGTWLDAAGYRSGLMGKYLNHYPATAPTTYVPPGWDEWAVDVNDSGYPGFNYKLNENGTIRSYGNRNEDYATDVLRGKAEAFIRSAAEAREPFFLYLAPWAPHEPATPAPRHRSMFSNATAPRTPSYLEPDVSDKPKFVQERPAEFNKDQNAFIAGNYPQRLRSLQAVDEMVEGLIDTLEAENLLATTYIVYSSDNGWHLGQHRSLGGKYTPYEEDSRVPLIIRGPGIRPGTKVGRLAGNIDLAPTFADIANAQVPSFVDGRSLLPLALGESPRSWREGYLLAKESPERYERFAQRSGAPVDGTPPYRAVRTATHVYVEYPTGEKELYDLAADPHQLENIAATAPAEQLDALAALLEHLNGCAGASCHSGP